MVYKKKSAECLRSVSEHNLNIYSDFFFHTFMQHFKLYQFVYLNDRQCNVNKIHLEVSETMESTQNPVTEIILIIGIHWHFEARCTLVAVYSLHWLTLWCHNNVNLNNFDYARLTPTNPDYNWHCHKCSSLHDCECDIVLALSKTIWLRVSCWYLLQLVWIRSGQVKSASVSQS